VEPRSGFLSSPRRRRRLAWSSGVLAFLAGLVAFAVLYPDVERPPEVMSNEPAVVPVSPRNVPLTKEIKAATIETGNTFLHTAVARDHPERSWEIVHPTLREGYTKRSWATGEIPVVPYPVDSAIYRLDYSHPGLVGWKVSVYPKAGSETEPMTFYMDVTLVQGRWRVSNWSPASMASAAPGGDSSEGGANAFAIGRAQESDSFESRVSPVWLLIPVALLGLLLAAIGGKSLRDWRRAAAVERTYRSNSNPS
jgi:hypothetical protein